MNAKEKMTDELNPELNKEQVRMFLEKCPEFIEENHGLLLNLAIGHSSGAATSLLEKQNSLLRQKIAEQTEERKKLVSAANENWSYLSKINDLTQELIGIDSLSHFIEKISNRMSGEFGADKIVLEFVRKKEETKIYSNSAVSIKKFEPYFDHLHPFSGPVSTELDGLYEGSEIVIKSHVIVPMNTPEWKGVILLGSKDVDRYRGDLETEFLSLLRDILVLTVAPMLSNEGFEG